MTTFLTTVVVFLGADTVTFLTTTFFGLAARVEFFFTGSADLLFFLIGLAGTTTFL